MACILTLVYIEFSGPRGFPFSNWDSKNFLVKHVSLFRIANIPHMTSCIVQIALCLFVLLVFKEVNQYFILEHYICPPFSILVNKVSGFLR